ncbi:BatD family protein [Gemmatimonadota bacterium]
MKRAGLAVLILALCSLPCVAQDRASAHADVDLDIVSLGDRLTLTVEVEHLTGQTVVWPALPDTLGSFEVLGAAAGETVVAEGHQTSTMHYALTTFELGELEIPGLDITVADSGAVEPQSLSTAPIRVLVESVGLDEGGDIRTVKAPLDMPRNWLLLIPWVLLVCGLIALGYWLYRRYRARDRTPDIRMAPTVPARPPHEVAYEALDRLEAKHLLERGEIKQYFIEVSEIIRTYLEGRYPIDALEMTSHEVLRELKKVGLEPEVVDLFPPFFSRSDLVKFAKHRPGPEISKEMIPMARLLIDETRVPDSPAPMDPPVEGDAAVVAAAEEEIGAS